MIFKQSDNICQINLLWYESDLNDLILIYSYFFTNEFFVHKLNGFMSGSNLKQKKYFNGSFHKSNIWYIRQNADLSAKKDVA